MGIKHFWYYIKNTYGHCIETVNKENKENKEISINIDNLLLDLNAIFHNSARKIYNLDNMNKSLLIQRPFIDRSKKTAEIYKDVTNKIDEIIRMVNPKKRIVFCIDGPAPLSKQNQQRQRRFRSAYASNSGESEIFNSASISPGTKFLHFLGKHIEKHIINNLMNNESWKNLEIIFSNEKTPGEGEAKCFNYVRYHSISSESYLIFGNDADLIMLSLCCKIKDFYIFREDTFSRQTNWSANKLNDFFLINIDSLRNSLIKEMKWENEKTPFKDEQVIIDFVFLCFIVGNDFLPNIPSIEIMQRGIDLIIDIYKIVCSISGHITKLNLQLNMEFNKESLIAFFKEISKHEKELLEKEHNKPGNYPNELLDKHMSIVNGKFSLNLDNYKNDYYSEKMVIKLKDKEIPLGISEDKDISENKEIPKGIKEVCHDYLKGMVWVLNYYTKGVSDWTWLFPNYYGPFASDLSECIMSYVQIDNNKHTQSLLPFQQLLCILPPSADFLLPSPLNTIFRAPSVKKYYPEEIKIDLSGKSKDWQGIVVLPHINLKDIMMEYNKLIDKVESKELIRNKIHKSVIYKIDKEILVSNYINI